MDILEKIILHKQQELALRKEQISVAELEKRPFFSRNTLSFRQALQKSESGVIAEHKRKSPSKGVINQEVTVEIVVEGYESAGAAGISVLTDEAFFDGSDAHLLAARAVCRIPLLRKDFIIDEYQVLEARSLGADMILLIAANLNPLQTRALAIFAQSLNLEVLLEVHDETELNEHLNEFVDIVGVNNRNLKKMQTDLNTSRRLSELIPVAFLKISESGISQPEVLLELKNDFGYNGFLIGEFFMQQPDPGKSLQNFIQKVNALYLNTKPHTVVE
jgi:indole-3-glycerol phosphate synthase